MALLNFLEMVAGKGPDYQLIGRNPRRYQSYLEVRLSSRRFGYSPARAGGWRQFGGESYLKLKDNQVRKNYVAYFLGIIF